MKYTTIIAFLILGIWGCAKTEKPSELSKIQSEIKHPPLIYGQVCIGCGSKYDWGKWYCRVSSDVDGATTTYYTSCGRIATRTDSFYDYNVLTNINNQHPGTYLEPDLDTVFAADFLNNWMSGFPAGAQYYGHFEFISHVAFKEGIPLLDIPMHYAFARDTYTVADSLMNGSWDCVPITTLYKEDAEDMIDYYRLKLSEPLFQTTLDSIQSDLNRHVGKTKTQIYSFYEN